MTRLPAAALVSEKQATIDSFEAFIAGEGYPRWPLEIFVEVSNLCDLKCAMCPTFSGVSPDRLRTLRAQDRGFFEAEASWRSLERLLPHALYLHAFGYGEPTIHPRFRELLTDLARFEVMTDFFTNGMHLSGDLCRFLVDARVAKVTVSFSGATRTDYENVYLGGEFERVLGGLSRLASERVRAGSRYPQISINSIAFAHHVERLPEFVDLMAEHGVDIIEVKKLVEHVESLRGHAALHRPEVEGEIVAEARRRAAKHGITFSSDQYERESARRPGEPAATPIESLKEVARTLVPRKPDPQRETRVDVDLLELHEVDFDFSLDLTPLGVRDFGTAGPFHCLEPFKTLYVRKNGMVKPCCFAPDTAPMLGDVRRMPGDLVWRGAGFDGLRDGVVAGHYPKAICAGCIRAGTAPQHNVMRALMRAYAEWYEARFGRRLSVQPGSDVPPAALVANVARRHPEITRRMRLARPTRERLAQVVASRARSGRSIQGLIRGGVEVLTRTLVAGWVDAPSLPDERWRLVVRHPALPGDLASGEGAP